MNRRILLGGMLVLLGACGTNLDLGPALAPDGGPSDDAGSTVPHDDAGAALEASSSDAPGSVDAPPPSFDEQAKALGARWEWLTPKPTGESLNAVAGTRMSDLWFVGSAGTVLYSDGHTFTTLATSDEVTLDIAWAPSERALWTAGLDADGRGHLFRVHGSNVAEDATFGGFAVQTLAGLDETHAFVAGPGGEVRAWNGSAWSVIRAPSSGYTRGLHAFSPVDVWAVGDGGKIDHYDGKGFSPGAWDGVGDNPLDPTLAYDGVWGAAPDDVWAVAVRVAGSNQENVPVLAHFDGATWRIVQGATSACGPSFRFVPHANGVFWASHRSYGNAVAGIDASNILLSVGDMCPRRWDGATWSAEPVSLFHGEWGVAYSQAGVTALAADRTLIAGTERFDPGAPPLSADGDSARFKRLISGRPYISSPALDEQGVLWARTCSSESAGLACGPSIWGPEGFSTYELPFDWSQFGFASNKNLFARAGDIWVSQCAVRPGSDPAGVGHWDGARWTLTEEPTQDNYGEQEVVVGNDVYVWTFNKRYIDADGGPRGAALRRYARNGDFEAAVELDPMGGEWLDLAPDPTSPARVFAGYTVQLPEIRFPATVKVVVVSWDGAAPPRREVELPYTFNESPEGFDAVGNGLLRRIAWTVDGKLLVVTKHAIVIRQGDGTTITAVERQDLDFRDIAAAPGSRFWVLSSSGALYLWDPATNDFARARHPSPISAIVSAPNGEAWATGSGLLHFTPPEALPR